MPDIGSISNLDASKTLEDELNLLDKYTENANETASRVVNPRDLFFSCAFCKERLYLYDVNYKVLKQRHDNLCPQAIEFHEEKKRLEQEGLESGSLARGALILVESYNVRLKNLQKKNEAAQQLVSHTDKTTGEHMLISRQEYCNMQIQSAWDRIHKLRYSSNPVVVESVNRVLNEYGDMTPQQRERRYSHLEQIEDEND